MLASKPTHSQRELYDRSQLAIVEPREFFSILTFLVSAKYCPGSSSDCAQAAVEILLHHGVSLCQYRSGDSDVVAAGYQTTKSL